MIPVDVRHQQLDGIGADIDDSAPCGFHRSSLEQPWVGRQAQKSSPAEECARLSLAYFFTRRTAPPTAPLKTAHSTRYRVRLTRRVPDAPAHGVRALQRRSRMRTASPLDNLPVTIWFLALLRPERAPMDSEARPSHFALHAGRKRVSA
jgi:hypothetical protein